MGTITHMSKSTYVKVTGVPKQEKCLWQSRAALLGESLSEYLLTNMRVGELHRKHLESKAAEAEAIFVTRSSREAERRKGGA